MMKRKNVLFVLPSLAGGGAERVMLTLLKHLDRKKYQPSLALIVKQGPYVKELPADIEVYDLKASRVRHSFLPLIKLIREVKPDTVLSTQGHLNIALILLKPFFPQKTRLIVREAITVSEHIKAMKYAFMWKWFYRHFYHRADLIICQSKYMMKDLANQFHIPVTKMVQIYNPVNIASIKELANKGVNPYFEKRLTNIVAIGRLHNQKGFDRLIQSFPGLLKMKPDAKLWILGTGPLEDKLKELTRQLRLEGKVVFAGFQDNPYNWLKHADLFVLSSNYEGLPNVLLEAISCGCPVISTDHPGGTKEIMELTKQQNRLVQDIIWKEKWFERPDQEVSDALRQHFRLEHIVDKYSEVL